MTDANGLDQKVEILPPDKSLLHKVGAHNVALLLGNRAEAAGQFVINAAAGDFRTELRAEFQQLEETFHAAADPSGDKAETLDTIIDIAFSISSKAGLGGYQLVSALAKSLQLYCEARNGPMSDKTRDMIDWHIQSIDKILKLNVMGDGGTVGEALKAELAKLTSAK